MTFAAGQRGSKTIRIKTCDDIIDEVDKTLTVELFNPTAAGLGTRSATGTLLDNDAPSPYPDVTDPTFFIDSPTVTEGDDLTFTITFMPVGARWAGSVTVTLDGDAALAAANAECSAGVDAHFNRRFSASQDTYSRGSSTWQGGSTTNVPMLTCEDLEPENVETLTATMTTSRYSDHPFGRVDAAVGNTGTGTIIDDDTAVVTASIRGPSGPVAEEDPNGLPNAVVFTIELDDAATEEVTVTANTTAGTASGAACASGGDFLQRSMTVRFNPGDTSKSFSVRTCTDGVPEHDETFMATISNPTNAVLGTATTATATIRDNDEPTVSISAPSAAVIEDTSGVPNTLTFAVTLDVAGVQAVTVVASTSSGTAAGGTCGTSGIDFVSRSATVTFTAGDTSEDFTVATCADTTANEGLEEFTVSLSNPTNAALGTSSATGQILDDDTPPIYR